MRCCFHAMDDLWLPSRKRRMRSMCSISVKARLTGTKRVCSAPYRPTSVRYDCQCQWPGVPVMRTHMRAKLNAFCFCFYRNRALPCRPITSPLPIIHKQQEQEASASIFFRMKNFRTRCPSREVTQTCRHVVLRSAPGPLSFKFALI